MPASTVARKAAARAVARKVAETTGGFALSVASTAARSPIIRRIVLVQVGLAIVVALAVPFLLLGISTASPPGAGADDGALVGAGDIPEVARLAYLRAAAEAREFVPDCKMRPSILAGIYAVASNHGDGRLNGSGTADPPIAGPPDEVVARVGPGRFDSATWSRSRFDGNGDGVADPQNIYDAALTTSVVVCQAAPGVDLDSEEGLGRVIGTLGHDSPTVEAILGAIQSYGVRSRPAGSSDP